MSPDDAVIGAPFSDAAAVRCSAHAHGAAPPVVLQAHVRFQNRYKNTHTHTHHNWLLLIFPPSAEMKMTICNEELHQPQMEGSSN